MPGVKAFGTFLQVQISTVWTNIANVTDITPIDASADIIDVSSHDSANEFREKLAGFKDSGDVKIELNYKPDNTTHQAVEDALATSTAFRIKYVGAPTGRVTGAFNGILKAFSVGAPHDGKLQASATFAVDGKVTWS